MRRLFGTTAAAAFALAAGAAWADDPRPVDPSIATSKDSGTVQRSDPEMAAIITKLMELGAKPVNTLTVEQARTQPTPADAAMAVMKDKGIAPPPMGKTEDIMVKGAAGDLPARVFWPAEMPAGNAALPVVVYFHGGGWVIATINTYAASSHALADGAKAIVVSIEYRKGPENKFPAAHDDAVAAYGWVVENAGKWNGDSKRIAVAGESAGGNLAVNVAIAARDQKLTPPVAVLAVYPVAGSDLNTQSYMDNQNAVPLGKADIEWFVKNYLNSMDEAKDPRIDIIGGADVSNLPPVTIVAAEIDPLNTDGTKLRDKLKAAGNDVAYQNWNGVTHEFFGMGAVVPGAKAAEDFATKRLMAAFAM